MSCGCAVVGSKGLPVSEVITDGVDGLLVSMDNVDELIYKVSFLLDHPSMRQSFASAARQRSFDFDQSKTLLHLLIWYLIQTNETLRWSESQNTPPNYSFALALMDIPLLLLCSLSSFFVMAQFSWPILDSPHYVGSFVDVFCFSCFNICFGSPGVPNA